MSTASDPDDEKSIWSTPFGVFVAMRRFGANLGIAYQLVDDALDYSGFEGALGKRVGDDFREGKMTLPVVLAIARARRRSRLLAPDHRRRPSAGGGFRRGAGDP